MASNASQIKRLLIANRGEIAARIIASARELGLTTIALYTDNDNGHIINAAEKVRLNSPAAYLDIDEIVNIAQDHNIDSIHPGYGFLSESADFAQAMHGIGVTVVGPGSEILKRTGDKLQARQLAEACQVPVLAALTQPTNDISAIEAFAEQHGYPIMVKAVDGGGGRGIRLIRSKDDLGTATRAIEESPSRQVFAERAAVDGFRHVEVQVVGDGKGNVMHLWERECSIQRRYQKVIELAPSTIDRARVTPLIEAALRMAAEVKYMSLGTFEFLLHPGTGEYYFLEINPRLQVEHTITESILNMDIVKSQLRLQEGLSLEQAGFKAQALPSQHALQLRISAEDPEKNWTLSTGKLTGFRFPTGNGIRVDTALVQGLDNNVSSDFDSVIAKIIVTAPTWSDLVSKARRAIEDTEIAGVTTNLAMLAAIVVHPDFAAGQCDTQWLESKHAELLAQSRTIAASRSKTSVLSSAPASTSMSFSSASTLFRKDDAWSMSLTAADAEPQVHHLRMAKVLKNDFPSQLTAQVVFTAPSAQPVEYLMDLKATTASASALSAQHRRGDPKNPSHVITPFSGKLVEVCVDVGDTVKQDECIAVVQQMKMELEVRTPHAGVVTWICDVNDGEDVSEGTLLAIVEAQASARSRL